MAQPKQRASMREGPLAALFRKTDEDSEEATGSDPRARESDAPPPPLTASGEALSEAGEGAPAVPSPRERLRHAFSSEIPENVMDRSPAPPPIDEYPRERPSEHRAPGASDTGALDQPVIRVVGV